MKQYKNKDFLQKAPQLDTLVWISTDKKFTITTTLNQYSQFFVYICNSIADEWLGIQTDTLDEAISELNRMIETEEIERFIF